MIRELIIDDAPGYARAAVVEDGVLCELHGEAQCDAGQAESLFYGRVQAVKPALKAAFVDIGMERHAFLPLTDELPRCGDMLIVQGQAKQATDTKGLRVTDKPNMAGRRLVLVPGGSGVRISRKIREPALRQALLDVGARICPPGCALIVRTASGDVTQAQLEEEAQALYARWQAVLKKAAGMTHPGLLDAPPTLTMRLARDLRDLSRIVVSSEAAHLALLHAQRAGGIDAHVRIERADESRQLIFDAFGIEPQIDKALKKRVWLPCGGYLIIDFCEAMTVIDVNSGKMVLGHDLEETAFRVNMEAADEIARQMRLRDVGGIVIADFIDMREEAHRQALVQRMREAAARDRAQVRVEGLTRLGLMEMSRKRAQASLRKALRTGCSYCAGAGEVLSAGEVARRALRQARRMMLAGQRGPFLIRCAPPAAQALGAMALREESAQVYALAVPGRHAERFEIEQMGEGAPLPADAVALKREE